MRILPGLLIGTMFITAAILGNGGDFAALVQLAPGILVLGVALAVSLMAYEIGTLKKAVGLAWSGRLASPFVKLKFATLGVKGCPVYMVPLPAICQLRSGARRLKPGDQMKLVAKAWPISKSDRPRSARRL